MEECQRCKKIDDDHRTLWMACFYDMNELHLPFAKEMLQWSKIDEMENKNWQQFFTLSVCKECRAEWMIAIKLWFESEKSNYEPIGTGIFVRHLGATIEVSEEEWQIMNPGIEPVRYREEIKS